jgi:hypothetical protein
MPHEEQVFKISDVPPRTLYVKLIDKLHILKRGTDPRQPRGLPVAPQQASKPTFVEDHNLGRHGKLRPIQDSEVALSVKLVTVECTYRQPKRIRSYSMCDIGSRCVFISHTPQIDSDFR